MSQEDIVLSEISQPPKDKCYRILLTCGAYSGQILRDREQKGGVGDRMGSQCSMGTEIVLRKVRKFWRQRPVNYTVT